MKLFRDINTHAARDGEDTMETEEKLLLWDTAEAVVPGSPLIIEDMLI